MSWVKSHISRTAYLGPLPDAQNPGRVSLGRRIGTVLSLLFGAFMCGLSLPYVTAMMNLDGPAGIVWSQNLHDTSKGNTAESWSGGLVSVNAVYLRPGQAVQANYRARPGTDLILVIESCKGIPVIELFSCQNISKNETRVTNDAGAVRTIVASGSVRRMYGIVIDEETGLPINQPPQYIYWQTVRKP